MTDSTLFTGTLIELEQWLTAQPTGGIANVHVAVTIAPPASGDSLPARSPEAGRGVVAASRPVSPPSPAATAATPTST